MQSYFKNHLLVLCKSTVNHKGEQHSGCWVVLSLFFVLLILWFIRAADHLDYLEYCTYCHQLDRETVENINIIIDYRSWLNTVLNSAYFLQNKASVKGFSLIKTQWSLFFLWVRNVLRDTNMLLCPSVGHFLSPSSLFSPHTDYFSDQHKDL